MTTSIWIALDVAVLTGIAIYIVHELHREDPP